MFSSRRLGGRRITPGRGGSEHRAIDANVSMMTLIHKQLQHRERRLDAEERSQEGDRQGADVDRQLELDEALDVLVERPAPVDRLDDGGEGVVEQDDLAGLLGDLGAGDAHGQADVGLLQGRGVVGAVAGDGHHLAQLLQQP